MKHDLAVIRRKSGALPNNAQVAELAPAFKKLQNITLRRPGGDHETIDILTLVRHYYEQAVLNALEMVSAEGVAAKTHMLKLQYRPIDEAAISIPRKR